MVRFTFLFTLLIFMVTFVANVAAVDTLYENKQGYEQMVYVNDIPYMSLFEGVYSTKIKVQKSTNNGVIQAQIPNEPDVVVDKETNLELE